MAVLLLSMKELRSNLIRTSCGKTFDLLKSAPIASNAAAPYGKHNFMVYRTTKGFFLKGYNTGTAETMLNVYELISRNEAMAHLNREISNTTARRSYL